MDSNERIRAVSNLRYAFQSKSRLRLEFLGELSKILRVHGQAIPDELLASIVVAIPEELPGEGFASSESVGIRAEQPERPPTENRPPITDRPPKAPREPARYIVPDNGRPMTDLNA
jgi:hypothetical protein